MLWVLWVLLWMLMWVVVVEERDPELLRSGLC